MPRVSILTAAHIDTPEKDTWLQEAIGSVQGQEFTDWEMIIVDDASSIPVEPVGDPRVRVVRASRQQGPAMCRNTAVGLARAEALLPLDADDQLASPDVLGTMLEQWEQDPGSIVYGDMQYLDDGVLGKVLHFPEYDFQKVLDPKGVIPVSAMHSRECWEAAGGWKSELEQGLEDVEYWIAAGAAGYCGVKIDMKTLIYRRHDNSRSRKMRAARLEGKARNMIREMHAELYEGRFPMGCCGGSRSKQIGPKAAPGARMSSPPRRLDGVDAPTQHTTIWVRYNGKRGAKFGVRGKATGVVYEIFKQGDEFEIYTVDASIFRRSGRGRDFSVGIAPPASEPEPEPEQQQPEVEAYQGPPPKMAQIMDLDAVAREERGVAPEPAPAPSQGQAATPRPVLVQPPPPLVSDDAPSETLTDPQEIEVGPPRLPTAAELAGDGVASKSVERRLAVQTQDSGLAEMDAAAEIIKAQAEEHPLEALDLGRFQEMLEHEGWTIPGLAVVDAAELTPYPGIGAVTAGNIIEKAKEHMGDA